MTSLPDLDHISAVLLDIEGTTTPVDFVYLTLFPYARDHAKSFLKEHWNDEDLASAIRLLRREHDSERSSTPDLPPWNDSSVKGDIGSALAFIRFLMARDRKSTGLKVLQGLIWEAGYRSGDLRGEVYPDVPEALERLREMGKEICIYSSGSVLAQKLLFGTTPQGDLTSLFLDYFDTTVGPKKESASYRAIASKLQRRPGEILFVSDVPAELDAAAHAGLRTALCIRPGSPEAEATIHPVINSMIDLFQAPKT